MFNFINNLFKKKETITIYLDNRSGDKQFAHYFKNNKRVEIVMPIKFVIKKQEQIEVELSELSKFREMKL